MLNPIFPLDMSAEEVAEMLADASRFMADSLGIEEDETHSVLDRLAYTFPN